MKRQEKDIAYEKLFHIVKIDFLQRNGKTFEAIENFYNSIAEDSIEKMSDYASYAKKEFKRVEKTKGLCAPLSSSLLDLCCFLSGAEYACLTIGKIEDTTTKQDIFAVGNKENFLLQFPHHHIEKLGGNMHVWITLSDGTIIDPSIKERLIIGSPTNLENIYKYKYFPYIINEIVKNDSTINEQNLILQFKKKIEKIIKRYI